MRKLQTLTGLEQAKVEFKRYYDYVNGLGHPRPPLRGTLLRFGEHAYFGIDGTFQVTVAIVFGEDNRIYNVPPDALTILSRPS